MKVTAVKKPEKKPRISVNKLAEYLEAISTRRRKIVEDAKYPEKFIVTRYKDARGVINNFLSNNIDEEFVLDTIIEFENKESDTEFQEQDNRLSGESLESILEADISLLDGCEVSTYEDKNELIEISGVDISVNPDLLVTKIVDGVRAIGAMKLHISKTNQLSDESQKVVAVMLYLYVGKFIIGKGEAENPKLCLSFDVFKQCIECCPTSYKHRIKKIEAACEEIGLWWDKL